MAHDDLAGLERDVEAARAKLMGDIAALRSPGGLTDLPETLKQAALDRRDRLFEDAKSRSRTAFETLREKAVANPTAALVIGAGLAWHFMRRPPIAAALIGGGLFGLLRTPVDGSNGGRADDALMRARQNLKAQADELGERAGRAARDAAHAVGERAGDLAEDAKTKAAVLAAEGKEKAAELTEEARQKAAALAGEARHRTRAAVEGARDAIAQRLPGGLAGDEEEQLALGDLLDDDAPLPGRTPAARLDTILVGIAGLALGAAIATLYQRNRAEPVD